MVEMDGYVDRSTLTPFVRLKLISAMDEEIELSAIIDTGYNGEVILSENKNPVIFANFKPSNIHFRYDFSTTVIIPG